MRYAKIKVLAFSPCKTTKNSALIFAEALADSVGLEVEYVGFTLPDERKNTIDFAADEIAVIAVPTYAGKVPNKISPDMRKQIKGHGGIAIPIVTYGNRAYENSLAELKDILDCNDFHSIAAAVLLNEHSMFHTAAGRPDPSDVVEIEKFAENVAKKIKKYESSNGDEYVNAVLADAKALTVPGDAKAAYYVPKQANGSEAKILPVKPKVDKSLCIRCKACVRVCPMGATAFEDESIVTGTCIKCFACVNLCPAGAKYFDDPQLLSHKELIQKTCADRKPNEFFI